MSQFNPFLERQFSAVCRAIYFDACHTAYCAVRCALARRWPWQVGRRGTSLETAAIMDQVMDWIGKAPKASLPSIDADLRTLQRAIKQRLDSRAEGHLVVVAGGFSDFLSERRIAWLLEARRLEIPFGRAESRHERWQEGIEKILRYAEQLVELPERWRNESLAEVELAEAEQIERWRETIAGKRASGCAPADIVAAVESYDTLRASGNVRASFTAREAFRMAFENALKECHGAPTTTPLRPGSARWRIEEDRGRRQGGEIARRWEQLSRITEAAEPFLYAHAESELFQLGRYIHRAQNDGQAQTPAPPSKSQTLAVGTATVNARMIDEVDRNPAAIWWGVRRWATHLKCSTGTVLNQPMWGTIRRMREEARATARHDRSTGGERSDRRRNGRPVVESAN
jgi:hypothetical protein